MSMSKKTIETILEFIDALAYEPPDFIATEFQKGRATGARQIANYIRQQTREYNN